MYTKKLSRTFLYGLIFVLVGFICLPAFAEGADNFGVHIFRGAEVETACQMVEDADIGWHRGDVLWKNIVDNGGNFNWTNLDGTIESILGHKINIILTLRSIHELFAPGSGKIDVGYDTFWRSAPPAPEYLENYKDFIRQIVERYDGDGLSDAPFVNETKNIKHWQIENELANKPDGGSVLWKNTAADYADLFIVAYNVIKETDPEAKVALCGFTDSAIEYFMKYGNAFPCEVVKIINEKGSDFDIFDQHSYRNYGKLAKIITEVRKILGTYAKFTSKPIWVTETNVGTKQIDPSITLEEYNRFAAKDIVKRYSTLFSKAVKKVFWFKFSDDEDATWKIPMTPKDFGKFRGLTESNLTPKSVYYTYLYVTKPTFSNVIS